MVRAHSGVMDDIDHELQTWRDNVPEEPLQLGKILLARSQHGIGEDWPLGSKLAS
jgi:hypothetical protein